jgi:hypothetical protein
MGMVDDQVGMKRKNSVKKMEHKKAKLHPR